VNLRDLLREDRIVVPLAARNVRDATMQLARVLADSGALADAPRFLDLLKSEWPEDVVAVSGRAFLPHFRTDAAAEVAVALGVTPRPIARPGDPAASARVVILVVAPTSEASLYLRAMAALATALSADDVLEGLHLSRAPRDVVELAGLWERAVPAEVTVAGVMTTSVTAVRHDMTVREAAELMLRRDVASAPVIGPSGEVVGLLTDQHLMNVLLPQTVSQLSTGKVRAVRRKGPRGTPEDPERIMVRDVMDRSVLCLAEEQTIADVAALMLSRSTDRFPVTRDGALVGFLTRGDIVRKLLGVRAANGSA
jgi:CBS domain-containing protein